MYTYRRFKIPKSAVTVILIALALVAWGILGLTGTPLAKKGGGGKATYKVELVLARGSLFGTASWQTLDALFDREDDIIQVDGKNLDLFQMSLKMKAGKIDRITLFFKDIDTGTVYHTWQNSRSGWLDVEPVSPEIGVKFEIKPINPSAELHSGREEALIERVHVGVASYTPE